MCNGSGACCYVVGTLQKQQFVYALIPGLLFDLTMVGIVKLAVRRDRPAYNRNDQFYDAPVVDKFSFPSGHTSRGSMLTMLA